MEEAGLGLGQTGIPIHPLELPVTDDQSKSWEYWLQVSLHSLDLHTCSTFSLCSADQEMHWQAFVRANIPGPMLLCWVELAHLGFRNKDEFLSQTHIDIESSGCGGPSSYSSSNLVFTVGRHDFIPRVQPSPAEVYGFVLCKIAVGKTFTKVQGR